MNIVQQTTIRTIRIALTGGPCGGKSTLLPLMRTTLQKHGMHCLVVPEVARSFIESGILPNNQWKDPDTFQIAVVRETLRRELLYEEMLRAMVPNELPIVLLCDRGVLDGAAYYPTIAAPNIAAFMQMMLSKTGASRGESLRRYDMVIHLTTAANGAEDCYVIDNERTETPEEARIIDYNLRRVYQGHVKHVIITNTGSFGDKMNRAMQQVNRILPMPTAIEIERKFVVCDDAWRSVITGVEPVRIEQAYLCPLPNKPGIERRIRSYTHSDGRITYVYTEKTPHDEEVGGRHESETPISFLEYRLFYTQMTSILVKNRYRIPHQSNGHVLHLELDVYEGRCAGLVVIEIEFPTTEESERFDSQSLHLSVREVTNNAQYSNFRLAHYGLVK